MITINWKTYKPTNAWHFSVQAILNDLIEKDCLEEVKENKEPDTSILEKLREYIKEEERDILHNKNEMELKEYDAWKLHTFQLITDLLTSLENSSEIPNSSPISKMETTQFTPWQEDFSELPKINDTNLLEDVCVWTPKPWQEIEVSNDGEKWEKRTFQNMIKEKFQCWQTEEEHNKTTMFLKLWQFARPLEQVTIPEFDYDKIHMEAMKDHVGSFATHVAHPLCKQMSEITHFLHSQFPNSKPWKN